MIHEIINLRDRFPNLNHGILTTYILDNSRQIDPDRKRPAILIIPGGAYLGCSEREGEAFAVKFMAEGYHSFIFNYSVAPIGFPNQVTEAAAAVAYIRENAETWNVDADKIAVMGFSSGGHLSATLATMWNRSFLSDALNLDNELFKPNALILSYPVITSEEEYSHKRSFEVLLGTNSTKKQRDELSLEKQVGKHVPQTFIWHTLGDTGVLCENSLLFASALRRHNVPFELHIYPEGEHALALATKETAARDEHLQAHTSNWFNLCCKWLATRFE